MPAMSSIVAGRINICYAPPRALWMRGGGLLLPVGSPALIDQVCVDGVDVLLVQDVVESLHPGRREHSLQHDVLECGMQALVELAQVRGAARPEHMAARTLRDELELTGIDLRLAGGLGRRFGKRLFLSRGRRRHGAAAPLERNDAGGVLILERGAARRDGA